MKPFSDLRDDELAAALLAVRPEPSPAFAAELDERAAAGFPRRASSQSSANPFSRLAARLSSGGPRRMLIPAGGLAVAAIAVATVVAVGSNGGSSNQMDVMTSDSAVEAQSESGGAAAAPNTLTQPAEPSGASGSESGEKVFEAEAGGEESSGAAAGAPGAISAEPTLAPKNSGAAAGTANRDVERGAEITLGTKPGEVGEASAKVFQAVHAYDGIVLNSSTTNGSGTDAEAQFELLIPSARLDDAMAAFSKIGEVRSRHESTQDITAPTVGASERLQDSSARIEGLLTQLSEATVESEREAVEAELSSERGHAARLRAKLSDLKRRANLSHVSLWIESGKGAVSPGGAEDGGGWGVDDAVRDAGHLLATAAGVLIVAFAVAAPLALILILAWLAGRIWTRRARERERALT
jgi:hypothetical protein